MDPVHLPLEIYIRVFLYLQPKELDIVPLVCRSWHAACGDVIWMKVFREKYGTLEINPICQGKFSWRKETVLRDQAVAAWRRRNCYTVTKVMGHHNITDIWCSFGSKKVICYSEIAGEPAVLDLKTGKPDRTWRDHNLAGVRTVVGSVHGAVVARTDGSVWYKNFRKPAVKIYADHESTPAEVAIIDHSPPMRCKTTAFAVADYHGKVAFIRGIDRSITEHTFSSPVSNIEIYGPDKALVLTSSGIIDFDIATQTEKVVVKDAPLIASYNYGYAVYVNSSHEYSRVDLTSGEIDRFASEFDGSPVSAAYSQCVENANFGYLLIAYWVPGPDDLNTCWIVCWQVNGDSQGGKVAPLWVKESPLKQGAVTAISHNQVVVLCVAVDGSKAVLDILNGRIISKFRAQSQQRPANVPRTAEVDYFNPMEPRAVVAEENCLVLLQDRKELQQKHKKPTKSGRTPKSAREDGTVEIADDDTNHDYLEYMDRRDNVLALRRATENMTDQEQVEYAMLISETQASPQDPDLERALQASTQDSRELTEEEQLTLALEMSQLEISEEEQLLLAIERSQQET